MPVDTETPGRGVSGVAPRLAASRAGTVAAVLLTVVAVAALVTVPLLARRAPPAGQAAAAVSSVPAGRRVPLQGGAKLSRDARRLTVYAYGGGCAGPFAVAADQQADRVVLTAVDQYRGGDQVCTAELRVVGLTVVLGRPLAGRRVIDASSGRSLPVYPTLRPGYLPTGYRGEPDCIPEIPEPARQQPADLAGCTFRFSQDPDRPGLTISYTTAPLPSFGDITWSRPTATTVNGHPATLRVGRIPAKPGGQPQYERWLTWADRGLYYTIQTMIGGLPDRLLPPAELIRIGETAG
jgi:hypothetical protein